MLKLCVAEIAGSNCLSVCAYVVASLLDIESATRKSTTPVCADGWKRLPLFISFSHHQSHHDQMVEKFAKLLDALMLVGGLTPSELATKLDLLYLKQQDMKLYDLCAHYLSVNFHEAMEEKDRIVLRATLEQSGMPNNIQRGGSSELDPTKSTRDDRSRLLREERLNKASSSPQITIAGLPVSGWRVCDRQSVTGRLCPAGRSVTGRLFPADKTVTGCQLPASKSVTGSLPQAVCYKLAGLTGRLLPAGRSVCSWLAS
eukprot:gene2416-8733_t